MTDRTTEILEEHCAHWRKIIPLLEKGTLKTHEIRDGKNVDTTDETLQENRELLTKTEALIEYIRSGG